MTMRRLVGKYLRWGVWAWRRSGFQRLYGRILARNLTRLEFNPELCCVTVMGVLQVRLGLVLVVSGNGDFYEKEWIRKSAKSLCNSTTNGPNLVLKWT